ncbi:2-polyprenyl-3-methyl-6-methoxy-1,4-benzoquinone monooxygenase [Paucibacter sp. B2R-40]|uniref:2-polyprenyl-3-methyl-6-methoxy-1,4-benzoquinone monooxygenase n=1 Tax=Paucibacter sp. B2R-40 TaxID=2893554 RepID=UPI0021E36F57|nr:2-polyprenyl-3-methyl-6-methoxy-1,4-benzoquinone monooxygenase [Paucibacter sp. B2R-40]MCV2356172.1 2-polyprenyl-3-methyl-6-methoxy-1,4-benzoquinone monooxygenase [Paucibacter sp. B2R-40]
MPTQIELSKLDSLLASADHGLRTVFGKPPAARSSPAGALSQDFTLTPDECRLAGALMRVNHVGEICAQALYQSQALLTRDPELRAHFAQAAKEEMDHLAWTRQRIDELGSHTSRLNPLWYGGAFVVGSLAGMAGDSVSLGFVVETERQVEQHLATHLDRLPLSDQRSRAIVSQMKEEEARHAEEALAAGARTLPSPIKKLMKLAARLMTRTAHYI